MALNRTPSAPVSFDVGQAVVTDFSKSLLRQQVAALMDSFQATDYRRWSGFSDSQMYINTRRSPSLAGHAGGYDSCPAHECRDHSDPNRSIAAARQVDSARSPGAQQSRALAVRPSGATLRSTFTRAPGPAYH